MKCRLFIYSHVLAFYECGENCTVDTSLPVYKVVYPVVCNYESTNIIIFRNQTFLLSHYCEPSHFAILSRGKVASLVNRYSLFVHVSPILIFTTIVLSLTGIVKYHWKPLIFFIIPS